MEKDNPNKSQEGRLLEEIIAVLITGQPKVKNLPLLGGDVKARALEYATGQARILMGVLSYDEDIILSGNAGLSKWGVSDLVAVTDIRLVYIKYSSGRSILHLVLHWKDVADAKWKVSGPFWEVEITGRQETRHLKFYIPKGAGYGASAWKESKVNEFTQFISKKLEIIKSGSGASQSSPFPEPESRTEAGSASIVDEITKLADLHKKGLLTDEEFTKAKSRLLGKQ